MQSEIDENTNDLQYFYEKRRTAKKQIKRLKKTLNWLKNYQPKNSMRVCFQNEDISIVEEQISAYLLRVRWCTFQIKIKNKNHIKLLVLMEEVNKSMDLYFDEQYLLNASKAYDIYEEAAGAAFLLFIFQSGIIFIVIMNYKLCQIHK